MRLLLPPIVACLLSACVTNADRLIASDPPMKVYHSARAPLEIVQCMNNLLHLPAEPRDGAWSISRGTDMGVVINWFVRPEGPGSVVELRRANKIAPGIATAERCFG